MNKEMTELLQQLAAKLGTTAEHLWAVMIKQAFISGCCDLLLYAFTIALIWWTVKKSRKWWQFRDDDDLGGLYICLMAAMGILSFCFVIGCIASFQNTITAFANPEYWALMQILEAVGGQK